MHFSEALKAMRMGSKVAREKWRGEISYMEIVTRKINDEELIKKSMLDGSNHEIAALDDSDILADDWWILP